MQSRCCAIALLAVGLATLACETKKPVSPAQQASRLEQPAREQTTVPPTAAPADAAASSAEQQTTTPDGFDVLAKLPNPALSPALVRDGEVHASWKKSADAHGTHGVVTSVEDNATRAGVSILEAGGNAIDAAVATALALAVTHPSAGNIGGGGFLMLRHNGSVEAIDFRENSPGALSDEKFWKMIAAGGKGPAAAGVPGTVAGLYLAHQRHGVLPWKAVVEPARLLALNGFSLGQRQAQTLVWAQLELQQDPLAKQRFYASAPRAGTLIRQPELAKTLGLIAEHGAAGFYEGEVANDIVESMGDEGLITHQDLKTYKAALRPPLSFDFMGFRVVTMPAPSAGGVAVTQNLLMLQQLAIEKTKPHAASRLHLIAEASRRSQVERQLFVVAPDTKNAQENAAYRARVLDPQTWLGPHPVDRQHATQSSSLHPDYKQALAELPHTTHLSVVDHEGNLVSCTVTLSGSFGARVLTPHTGIVLNNSTASFSSIGHNTPRPASRTTSSMAPTLAFLGSDYALVLGSPGGDTIPNTVTQVFLHLAVDGMSLRDAVKQPRIHQGFVPQDLQLERYAPLQSGVRDLLKKLGHTTVLGRYAQGDANIASWEAGSASAVFDRREGGLAMAAARSAPPAANEPELSQQR